MRALVLWVVFTGALLAQVPTLPDGAIPRWIKVDSAGNGYAGGQLGSSDSFLAKYRRDSGALTYLQKIKGGFVSAIDIDSAGDLYAIGNGSPATLVNDAALAELSTGGTSETRGVFVIKLAPSGPRIYATFLGPIRTGWGLTVNNAGEAFITGDLFPGELPATLGAAVNLSDGSVRGFVAKLNAAGDRLLWINRGIGGRRVALDSTENVYVVGVSGGLGEPPITPGAFQSTHDAQACGGSGFAGISCNYIHVAKLDPTGTVLLYSTYYGGAYGASPSALAVDSAGNVLIAGSTNSPGLPTTPGVIVPAYQAAPVRIIPTSFFRLTSTPPTAMGFVAKLNGTGSALVFSTYFGGTQTDSISDLRLSGDWLYLSGTAGSEDAPGLTGFKQECLPRQFVTRMSSDGTTVGDMKILTSSTETIAVGSDGVVWTAGLESVDAASAPVLKTCVTDAASGARIRSVAPGQVISVFGSDLAPRTEFSTATSGQTAPTQLSNLNVEFDGIAAPLLYVSDRQANVIVPYDIVGRDHVRMRMVTRLSRDIGRTESMDLTVVNRQPAAFPQLDQPQYCGLFSPLFLKPRGLARNEDGSINSCANPAHGGSAVTLYLNGAGLPGFTTTSGLVAASPTEIPVRVTGTANGQPLDVVHVSLDPTSVTSVWRLQIVVPSASGPIEIVPLVDGIKLLQGSLYIFAAP